LPLVGLVFPLLLELSWDTLEWKPLTIRTCQLHGTSQWSCAFAHHQESVWIGLCSSFPWPVQVAHPDFGLSLVISYVYWIYPITVNKMIPPKGMLIHMDFKPEFMSYFLNWRASHLIAWRSKAQCLLEQPRYCLLMYSCHRRAGWIG
jgi:hypothetical protein